MMTVIGALLVWGFLAFLIWAIIAIARALDAGGMEDEGYDD